MGVLARLSLFLSVLGLALSAGTVAAAAERDQTERVDIRGTVTMVTPASEEAKRKGTLATLLVEGTKDKTTSYDKAAVRITTQTKVEKLVGKDRKPAKVEELKKGCKVQALFTGPVAESYPVQATAQEILIVEEVRWAGAAIPVRCERTGGR
jgi:beta-N-acetylhexosaminidase